MKTFVYIVITIVAVSVVAGFFIVGSPKEERARKQDDQRVQHLQFIQSEIINYWINKEKLPEDTSFLQDNIRGIVIPKDPVTGADYEYKILDNKNLQFSLCADFKLPSLGLERSGAPKSVEPYFTQQNWSHGAGMVCFERTIDEDFYRPRPKIEAKRSYEQSPDTAESIQQELEGLDLNDLNAEFQSIDQDLQSL